MAVESFECARHSLLSRSTVGPSRVGPGKSFKIKVPRRLEYTILRLVFANTIFHKRAILIIC